MSKWIDITKQEPPKGVPLLITDGKLIASAMYKPDFLHKSEPLGYCWSFEPIGIDGQEWSWTFEYATHWMLLDTEVTLDDLIEKI